MSHASMLRRLTGRRVSAISSETAPKRTVMAKLTRKNGKARPVLLNGTRRNRSQQVESTENPRRRCRITAASRAPGSGARAGGRRQESLDLAVDLVRTLAHREVAAPLRDLECVG